MGVGVEVGETMMGIYYVRKNLFLTQWKMCHHVPLSTKPSEFRTVPHMSTTTPSLFSLTLRERQHNRKEEWCSLVVGVGRNLFRSDTILDVSICNYPRVGVLLAATLI